MSTPTQRSLKLLRDLGWRCAIVERWNPHARIRQDLFGFVDILAIRGEETMAVQTTSGSGVSKRVRKITEECADQLADVRKAGWLVMVHGWRKVKPRGAPRERWEARIVDIS